jgi:hypothetical protein
MIENKRNIFFSLYQSGKIFWFFFHEVESRV